MQSINCNAFSYTCIKPNIASGGARVFQDGLTQETTPDITLTVLTPFKHADRLEHLDLSAQSLTHNEPLLQQR